MRVNNGISFLWYVIWAIWSLMGYKLRGDFILVVNLVKNESTMFFTIFIPYQTNWRICLGQINDFFWKNKKNCPFWGHFYSTSIWTTGFIKPNVCKYGWSNSSYLKHTPIFPPICPLFCPFSGPENKNVNTFSSNTILYITIIPLKHEKLVYVYILSR